MNGDGRWVPGLGCFRCYAPHVYSDGHTYWCEACGWNLPTKTNKYQRRWLTTADQKREGAR